MRWLTPAFGSDQEAAAKELASARPLQGAPEDIRPLIARMLVRRGLADPAAAERFLDPTLAGLHDPFLMHGMDAAVTRLLAAIANKEEVLIYGDYDVDGTTAVVILKTGIELCGGSAQFHVPHRIRDGYGMKDDVIERAAAAGVRLIISVDTGIRAFAAAETAARLGVDLIVTDHHLPHEMGVPRAFAVLNPNQPGCAYPCKDLCGAGVAFKLVQALFLRTKEPAERDKLLASFARMAAIATIADAVPLLGENRIFAKVGLASLRRAVNPGLRALMEVAQLGTNRPITATDVAFRLAPRLNAAGRMDVAQDVIELFTTRDAARARELAVRLDQLNAARQQEERAIVAAIEERLVAEPALREAFCVVLDGDGWHRGVIGICATRVVERTGRPALVISRDGDEAHGSGRSIPAFHLLNALEASAPLFTRYGGHAHAVGFALPAANVAALRAALDAYARTRLTLADFDPTLAIEAELPLAAVTPALFDALARLAPFGSANPEPVFAARGARLLQPPKPLKEKHVKLRVNQDSGRALDALGWRRAEDIAALALQPGDLLDLAFRVDENDHPDFGGLQLELCDVRRAQAATAVS